MLKTSVRDSWLLPALIPILALTLRLVGLSRYGFDGDEIFSVSAADSTWGHLFWTVANDKSHPPLFYVTLKLWLDVLPADEGLVRLLSVLYGVALVPVAAAICRILRLSRIDTALVLILISINGLLIFYSQHTRMFALLDLCAGVSILVFLNFIKEPFSPHNMVLLTATDLVLVYSHYWGWLLVFSELLIVLLMNRASFGRFLLSMVVVIAGFLPWTAAVGLVAARGKGVTHQIAWMGSEAAGVADYAWLFAKFNGVINFNHSMTFGMLLFVAPVGMFFVLWLRNDPRRALDFRAPVFWTILIGTPLLLTSLGSYIAKQNLWGDRHLSMVALPYFILVGLSVAMLPSRPVKIALRCLLLAWATIASSSSLAEPNKKLHFETLAMEIVGQDPMPIYAPEGFVIRPLEFYLERAAGHAVPVNEGSDLAEIGDQRFWFVYRNTTWHGQDPQAQLQALHDTIVTEVSTRSGRQEITALLVAKAAAARAGAPPVGDPLR